MSEEAVIKYINAPLTEETVKDLHAATLYASAVISTLHATLLTSVCMKRWSAAKSCLWT